MRTKLNILLLASISLAPVLSACGNNNNPSNPPTSGTPAPPPPTSAPPPAPPPTSTSFNVTPCLNQQVAGRSVADLIVPDTLRINLAQPSGFPNGRQYADPVIDVTLAVVFLNLLVHPATTFASRPLNPSGNDRPFQSAFPFLALPHGNHALQPAGGTNFNFRTEPASAFRRADRMGMPAVSTALIGDANKNAYNDDTPAGDATGRWVPELSSQLTALTNALADDFQRLGLTMCATRS